MDQQTDFWGVFLGGGLLLLNGFKRSKQKPLIKDFLLKCPTDFKVHFSLFSPTDFILYFFSFFSLFFWGGGGGGERESISQNQSIIHTSQQTLHKIPSVDSNNSTQAVTSYLVLNISSLKNISQAISIYVHDLKARHL